ncbi:MAG: hypothetical protein HQM09_06290 [Candidatus Riflebacteria bacterium]|nr:hypothetical protein [Candidatus Riflebacteria bacterium]
MNDDGSSKDLIDRLINEENRRVSLLQGIVDTAMLKIIYSRMSRTEALNLVLKVRAVACELFPDDVKTFDLIYMSRFKRVIDESIREETE